MKDHYTYIKYKILITGLFHASMDKVVQTPHKNIPATLPSLHTPPKSPGSTHERCLHNESVLPRSKYLILTQHLKQHNEK